MKRNVIAGMVVLAFLISTVLAIAVTVHAQTLEWTRVDSGGGFGDVKNQGTWSMDVLGGDVFAGTYNFNTGTEVWRYKNGSWTQVNADGFGDSNNYNSSSMAVYKNQLYVGTFNDPALGGAGCQVWRSNSSGTAWGRADPGNGFGDANNTDASCMAVYSNQLYVGTFNQVSGCRIWRYDGNSWALVDPGGGFGDPKNAGADCMAVYKNQLYVGITNISFPSTGGEVWRYDGGTSWTQVNTSGFGDTDNTRCPGMCVYGDNLYVGTANANTGAEAWRYNGTNWTQVNTNGFGETANETIDSMAVYDDGSGDNLYAGTFLTTPNVGCQVWEYDGSSWSKANVNGFGSTGNDTAASMVVSEGNFYVGTDNAATGCEIWRSSAVQEVSTWYLAEGTTAWGYDCYLSIENPNNEQVNADITYMTDTGAVSGGTVPLLANSQTTVNPRDTLGDRDFSTKVECAEGKTIAVDRTMSWTGEGAPSPDGHCSIGVPSPAKTWYLAEGSSAWGFECYLLIQNPNDQEATATVTYMIEDADPVTVEKKIGANKRETCNIAEDIGEKDASIKVQADIPVIPERAMYRDGKRSGHDSIGTTAPATDYYLAEGTTNYEFTTYVLIQNPNDTATDVNVTYLTTSGEVPHPENPIPMPANSRHTIRVNDFLEGSDFSTQVSGSNPIIAERAMYWGAGTALGEAAHDSIGMSEPHTTFYLPDGQAGDGYETYTLVANPNDSAVTVEITYLTLDGKDNVTFEETIGANSRNTFTMEHKGISGRAAVLVISKTAGNKIMVERAMYWNNRGAGTDTIGGYSD